MAEEKTVRKKIAKKATKKTTRKVVRKTAAKKIEDQKGTATSEQLRKAPTAVASRNAMEQTNRVVLYIGLFCVTLLIIISVVIGVMAEDSIVISDAVDQQREQATPEELEKINSIPVQGTKKRLPNGGLTPTPNTGKVPVKKEVPKATTTDPVASSTSETATTTQEVVEETNEDKSSSEENTAEETVDEAAAETSGL